MLNEELVKLLKARNGKAEIVIASDAEGNSFSGVEEVTALDSGTLVIWPGENLGDYDEVEK